MAIFTWIEGWYNPRRWHSGIGQKSPINFEKKLQDKAIAAVQIRVCYKAPQTIFLGF